MPINDKRNEIIDRLETDIANEVGNLHDREIESISKGFNDAVDKALKGFNSSIFDDNGFISKLQDINLEGKKDQDLIKNVLSGIRADYINADTLNQNELLLRRDLYNIRMQMPEMHDVVNVVRDAIIECDVSSGQVSRTITFQNRENTDQYETMVKEMEERHDLLMAMKNFIIPNTLGAGEFYIQIVPFSKLFAELSEIHNKQNGKIVKRNNTSSAGVMKESVPGHKTLSDDDNVKVLFESISYNDKIAVSDDVKTQSPNDNKLNMSANASDSYTKENIRSILENIDIYNDSSLLMSEMGEDGLRYMLEQECKEHIEFNRKHDDAAQHFMETVMTDSNANNPYNSIDQEFVDDKLFKDIKGCYIKYLDSLRVVPIRMDRRIVGYYYISTTMDLQTNSANPNGIVDLSFQHYTRDRNFVENLANLIIKSFDKKMLQKNIKLKNEIVDIIMAHKFSEGRLSFIYIPESEIVRIPINLDEENKGHSMLEPTMFPARLYLMLTLYNALYILNNNTTRVHYIRSSGIDKNYANQVQRAMRKFQSRRITIDDIYSYSGVLNKIGGMGEMVLPAGRSDQKAFETDTIEAVNRPIDIEFLEQQRRQALSATGAPHLLIINAIDEVDFAKTLEMANTRFLSTVSSYKIDFNRAFTKMYQKILQYETDIEPDIIKSLQFQFKAVKQQELNITSDMITNFNNLVELVGSMYFKDSELKDKDGNPTSIAMHLRRKLAAMYLPQLEQDRFDEMVEDIRSAAGADLTKDKTKKINIDDNDLGDIDDSQ